jgi:hypothetical protein
LHHLIVTGESCVHRYRLWVCRVKVNWLWNPLPRQARVKTLGRNRFYDFPAVTVSFHINITHSAHRTSQSYP